MKACTNYAVSREKLGKRDNSIKLLQNLTRDYGTEVRILNNLGILEKRSGNEDKA